MSPPDINLDKRGENRAMLKTWSTAQTPSWRQSHFPLDKDGKEEGMVQKAKTKWGDAEFSETVEGSSGVMSKSQEGAHFTSPSALSTDPLPLWAGAEPGRHRQLHQQSIISLQHFTYCHMTF